VRVMRCELRIPGYLYLLLTRGGEGRVNPRQADPQGVLLLHGKGCSSHDKGC
jgi:hypothetical protein